MQAGRPRDFYDCASQQLDDALLRAASAPIDLRSRWVRIIKEFCDSAQEVAKTHIAVLGTVILARATGVRQDLTRIDKGSSAVGPYYARGLAEQALVPFAHAASIDLGANGANPLNNSPYRGSKFIPDVVPRLSPTAMPLVERLLQIIEILEKGSQKDAQTALVAFVQLRRRLRTAPTPLVIESVPLDELAKRIKSFVASKSERGKRAQAVAAGVLDALHGEHSVLVSSSVHDPDRAFPGDVATLYNGTIIACYEVRDKTVSLHDAAAFLQKAAERGVTRVGIIAVGGGQETLDSEFVAQPHRAQRTLVRFYTNWYGFIEDMAHRSLGHPSDFLSSVAQRISQRLSDLDVSVSGQREWRELLLSMLPLAANT